MSIGPLGNAGAAGSPLAQVKGTAPHRAAEQTAVQRRQAEFDRAAAAAAGVSQPDGEDHQAAERDGDGQRPWEEQPEAEPASRRPAEQQSKDPSQQSGTLLDLTG
jgi:hypothetical protein